jgi:hypothetical protein
MVQDFLPPSERGAALSHVRFRVFQGHRSARIGEAVWVWRNVCLNAADDDHKGARAHQDRRQVHRDDRPGRSGERSSMSEETIVRPATAFPPKRGAARFLVATALLQGTLLPLAGCGSRASVSPDSASTASDAASVPARPDERPPIDPAVLRGLAEGHEQWSRERKARCPRQLPDRSEALGRYPTLSLLDGLGYITITDGTASGMYVKNMSITDEGRLALGSDLEENADWYVITVGRREYLPGTETFEFRPDRDRLIAFFRWRWKPLNPIGERLPLGSSISRRDYFDGFATYDRASDGWTLDKVFLNGEDGDF